MYSKSLSDAVTPAERNILGEQVRLVAKLTCCGAHALLGSGANPGCFSFPIDDPRHGRFRDPSGLCDILYAYGRAHAQPV